jgi:DNA mismatch endonuclease, patch repair protein
LVDVHSPAQRSFNMSRIRGKDTAPEIRLRSLLHGAGHRFRLHRKDLPGRPDIVFPRSRVAVYVHGCYWHRHVGCRHATTPSSNVEFWRSKFERTVERDQENIDALTAAGWTPVIVWECELRADPEAILNRIEKALDRSNGRDHMPSLQSTD